MTLVDVAILIVLAISAIIGLVQGFVRSVTALAGLVLGVTLACWNYDRPAAILEPMVHSRPIANAIGFVLIALLIMVILGFLGAVFAKALRFLGLGWLDMLTGAALGFLEGAAVVTICMIVTIAFFPKAHWMDGSRMPPMFYRLCDEAMSLSPADLAKRVREGLAGIQAQTPPWLKP